MYISDRDVFTQFVREIAPLLREQGLVVSVDVNDIQCYDKKALSEAVDYIMYMSYDSMEYKSCGRLSGTGELAGEIVKRVLEQEGVPRENCFWEFLFIPGCGKRRLMNPVKRS